MKQFLFLLFTYCVVLKAQAYPDFISYGYKSCLTCHYNGGGGGALTDYGRGVFATELVAKTFTSKTSDELGEESGFLGKTELPWWVHPGIKYRGLWYRTDVGSSKSNDRTIQMQADVDVAFHLDKKQNFVFLVNYGYVPTPYRFSSTSDPKPNQWISKQHYLRWQIEKGLFLYAGLFDKFYGIRHADHTAFNRGLLGLGQADQSHGLALQYMTEKYDVAGHLFAGNLSQDSDLRQKGLSLTGEYYIENTFSLGASALQSENNYKKETRYGLFSRQSFAKGKGFFFEFGQMVNQSKTTVDKKNTGLYGYLQGLINLSQGYNFLTTYQYYKPDASQEGSLETSKLGLGFLTFPYLKTEARFEIVNVRTVAEQNTSPDQWNLLGQLHLSW